MIDKLNKIIRSCLDEHDRYYQQTGDFGFDFREETNVGFLQRACAKKRPEILSIQEFHLDSRRYADLSLKIEEEEMNLECKMKWTENMKLILNCNDEPIPLQLEHDSDAILGDIDWLIWFIIPSIKCTTWINGERKHGKEELAKKMKSGFQSLIKCTVAEYGERYACGDSRVWDVIQRGPSSAFRFGVGIIIVKKARFCRKRAA